MEKLDGFIKQNRHEFNSHEPPKGHFERFKAKLDARQPARRINLWLVGTAAAIAGIVLTGSLSLLLNLNGLTPPRESGLVSANLSPELIQIDEYYQQQVNQKQQIISNMITGKLSPMELEIAKTLADLNSEYTSMLKELSLSPRPDRSAFVITRFYQSKIEVMEGMIAQLQGVYTLNQQN
jgi:hypothetical protein